MTTSLFLLFKEYADAGKMPSAAYIETIPLVSSDEVLVYLQKWMDIAGFFRYEKCNRYYDGENIKNTLYPYHLLEEEYLEQEEEYPTIANYIAAQFSSLGLINWRDEMQEFPQDRYFYYECDVTQDTLGEMAKRKDSSNAVILLNCGAIACSNPVELSSGSKGIVIIDHVNDIPSLHKWFSQNRLPQRVFDYNPKHGDDKHQAQMISGTDRCAAQLETNRMETQCLLELAIGSDTTSALWYYDAKRNKHIYFENQQEQRLAFHGYHLLPGEENYENIDMKQLALLNL